MSKSLFSPSWYRVAGMRPRLRLHAEIHRQMFRGTVWYILQDHQSGQYHRFSPAAHHFVCRMDGRRTVGEIWERMGEVLAEDQPTQDEVVRLLSQLHRADVLAGEIPPDMDELSARAEQGSRRSLVMRLRNPLAMRFPLFDPDRLLGLTVPVVGRLFTRAGLVLWLALIVTGLAVGAVNGVALVDNLTERAATAQNLVLLAVLYPLVKFLHELGHAFATKRWGGEVHELGVMLLILVPVPYVDASASLAFRSKWSRALVSGAGIMVEMALAAGAVLVWATVEPGLVKTIAFNVILIGGVSTLLFNGNPLLRLDGYYVLLDLLEIPNLASRANRYILYLVQRHAFGVRRAVSPVTAAGEPFWFVSYGIAAFIYRLFMLFTIALIVAGKLFVFGIVLALLSVTGTLIVPLFKGAKYLLDSPALSGKRRRAIAVTSLVVACLAIGVLAVPAPSATMAQGIIWAPDQATVRATADGFVSRVAARADAWVVPGTLLVDTTDPILAKRAVVIERQRDEYKQRLEAAVVKDQVQANLLREQVKQKDAEAALSREHLKDLQIVATKPGRFLIVDADDLPGRFLKNGDMVGYVVTPNETIVRVLVSQNDVDLVRRKTSAIAVRSADRIETKRVAQLLREVPSASAELPHMALSTSGGGNIVVDPSHIDPSHGDRPKAIDTHFQFDLKVSGGLDAARLGERVHVRFEHPPEALGFQLLRAMRQLFLRQFNV